LCQEIENGKYNGQKPEDFFRILSLLDRRTINDQRKMSNLEAILIKHNILLSETTQIGDYLIQLCNIPTEYAAVVYMEANLNTNSIIAKMVTEVFERYVFLSSTNKQFRKSDDVVKEILSERKIDFNTGFSIADDYEQFIEEKQLSLTVNTDLIEYTQHSEAMSDAKPVKRKARKPEPDDVQDDLELIEIEPQKTKRRKTTGSKKLNPKKTLKTPEKDNTLKYLLIFLVVILGVMLFMALREEAARVNVSTNIVIEFLEADSEAAEIKIGGNYVGTQSPGTIKTYSTILTEGSTKIEFTIGDKSEDRNFTVSETSEYHYFTFEVKSGFFRTTRNITYNGLISSAEAQQLQSDGG